jgi:hypothetical protein
MTTLEPDVDQLEVFTEALFRHVGHGYVSLRCFPDGDGSAAPIIIRAVEIDGRNLHALNAHAVKVARIAANRRDKTVFAPPIAVFDNPRHAREADLIEGPVISIECDRHPQQALKKLEGILGAATVVVASGGIWIDPETGEIHDKLHVHFRLSRPARGKEQLDQLKLARSTACALVGGDATSNSAVHPLRWPGSWHRKVQPRLCRIVALDADAEVPLQHALALLPKRPPPKPYVPPRRFFAQPNSQATLNRCMGLVKKVAQAPEHHRNGLLFWCANRAREMIQAGELDHAAGAQLLETLHAAALHAGLTADEITPTIRSVLNRGAA